LFPANKASQPGASFGEAQVPVLIKVGAEVGDLEHVSGADEVGEIVVTSDS